MSDVIARVEAAQIKREAVAEAQRRRLASKDPKVFTLILRSREVPVMSGRVSRSIDSVADGWTAEIAWLPGKDKELDDLVRPYSYADARVYLGPNLVNSGRLYKVRSGIKLSGGAKQLEGASYTADLVDSTIPSRDHAYSWSNLSVWNIAHNICDPLGIGVKTNLGIHYAERFEVVTASMTETYAELLTRLAFQRGMLVTNTEKGELYLTIAEIKGAPVCTLEEGKPPVLEFDMEADGRRRFYSYKVLGQSGLGDDIQSEAVDFLIPQTRSTAVVGSEVTLGNVGISARWKRNRQLIETLSFDLPVTGWYDGKGKLWAPNTLVHLVAPSIHVPKGFTFLIRAVEYELAGDQEKATLKLVPPAAYDPDAEIKEPWSA